MKKVTFYQCEVCLQHQKVKEFALECEARCVKAEEIKEGIREEEKINVGDEVVLYEGKNQYSIMSFKVKEIDNETSPTRYYLSHDWFRTWYHRKDIRKR